MDYMIFNVRTDVNACDCTRGCTDTVRESALKVGSGRKIPCRTGESNLRRQRAGPMLYQLRYIPTPFERRHIFSLLWQIIITARFILIVIIQWDYRCHQDISALSKHPVLHCNHTGVVAFSSLARIWGEYSTIHSPPALFFKVKISSRTLIPLFIPWSVYSGPAIWDDCGGMFPDKLRVSSFPDRFPHDV